MDFKKFIDNVDTCSTLTTGLADALKSAAKKEDEGMIATLLETSIDASYNKECDWLYCALSPIISVTHGGKL